MPIPEFRPVTLPWAKFYGFDDWGRSTTMKLFTLEESIYSNQLTLKLMSQFSHWYEGFGFQRYMRTNTGLPSRVPAVSSSVMTVECIILIMEDPLLLPEIMDTMWQVLQRCHKPANFNNQTLAGARTMAPNSLTMLPAGINSSTEIWGGDGCWCFIDQTTNTHYLYVYNSLTDTIILPLHSKIPSPAIPRRDFVNQCTVWIAANIPGMNGTTSTRPIEYTDTAILQVPHLGQRLQYHVGYLSNCLCGFSIYQQPNFGRNCLKVNYVWTMPMVPLMDRYPCGTK